MGAGSLGSSCGQCSVLTRGRAVLGGFFISWCVNFLLDQQIRLIPCLPVAVSVAREATGSGGRARSLLHAVHGRTRLC